jgi:hypothetical protein
VTITFAHFALIRNDRPKLLVWLGLTIALGVIFLFVQAYEYSHAYSDLNLKLSTGVYGSTFFMLTGFHGFHVTLGAGRGTSSPTTTSASRAWPGTGTSSTWCGSASLSSSTGYRNARSRVDYRAWGWNSPRK